MYRLSLLVIISVMISLSSKAQLVDGSIAPDFTLNDITGNPHNLYSYLNQGKYVALDISATWCTPCWNYHNKKVMDSLYEKYEIPGQWRVFFIEADGSTNSADLQGTGTNTQGNWLQGKNYTFIDPPSGTVLTGFKDDYNVGFYPMIYLICPDKRVFHLPNQPLVGQWENAALTCSTTNIYDPHASFEVTLYPNPARATVNIDFLVNYYEELVLELTDISGKSLDKRNFGFITPGHYKMQYSVEKLEAGIYFLRFRSVDGNPVSKKLLVY